MTRREAELALAKELDQMLADYTETADRLLDQGLVYGYDAHVLRQTRRALEKAVGAFTVGLKEPAQ